MQFELAYIEALRIDGLTIRQIRALAAFYETTTGQPPESIQPEDPARGIKDPDYKSPGVPDGYETIIGYLTEYEPEIWDIIDHFAEATARDGWWLVHRCRERGIQPIKVQACPWLIRQGIFEVNAYPIELLRERFSN